MPIIALICHMILLQKYFDILFSAYHIHIYKYIYVYVCISKPFMFLYFSQDHLSLFLNIIIYEDTQKKGLGQKVNDAGYRVLRDIDLSGKAILEIGPGGLHHIENWSSKPDKYVLVDIDHKFLKNASEKLSAHGVDFETRLTARDESGRLPAEDGEFDVIVTFYSLEHLYPFREHLDEMVRVLKPGGVIVGAIPTEGGLAWGMGRYITSRRWLKKNTTIDPDKIICWEHPNFADEILNSMNFSLDCRKLDFWPFVLPLLDVNLLVKFIYQKPGAPK